MTKQVRHLREIFNRKDACEPCRGYRGRACAHPQADKYRNCANRQHCELLVEARPSEVLQDILDSNCLSCNYTKEGRQVVEQRLQELILFMTSGGKEIV